MQYMYLALNWIFGIILLVIGLSSLAQLPFAGLCLITAAAFLLPPVRKYVHSKTNTTISTKARTITLSVLFFAYVVFAALHLFLEKKGQDLAAQQAQSKSAHIAQLRQKNIDDFKSRREQILSEVNKALLEKNYQSVISQSNKFLVAGDEELNKIHTQAKNELAKIEKSETTEKLLLELKGVSAQDYGKNKNIYQQLLSLHPDNDLYKTKTKFYADKVKDEEQKKIAAEERKKKIESQFSSWDGSHSTLEKFVKNSMNDSDSYEHVETVHWDRGDHLVVKTTFKGKNAFGGVVKNSVKAKITLDGQIIQILD